MTDAGGDRDDRLKLYSLYVGTAEKVSDRRQSANSFFLTINTGLVTLVGYLGWGWLAPIAGMVLCFAWYRLILSYRGLNRGKYQVILEMERSLPVRPFAEEWDAVGRGEDPSLYRPFTKIETAVPWVFFGLHATVLYFAVRFA